MAKKHSTEISQRIVELIGELNKDDNAVFLVGTHGEKIFLSIVDRSAGNATNYPLGWKTAVFIGYCLIVESMANRKEPIKKYLRGLQARRDDIIDWSKECSKYFEERKDG